MVTKKKNQLLKEVYTYTWFLVTLGGHVLGRCVGQSPEDQARDSWWNAEYLPKSFIILSQERLPTAG